MPASPLEPLVYHLFHLDSAAIIIILGGLYDSLGSRIKAHQACSAPCDNVLFSKSPREVDEVGDMEGREGCGGSILGRGQFLLLRCSTALLTSEKASEACETVELEYCNTLCSCRPHRDNFKMPWQ